MRRTHTKSRTGCTYCKHRKVKCDEAYPTCFNCKRHQVTCSLSERVSDSPAQDTGSSERGLQVPALSPVTPRSEAGVSAEPSAAGTPSQAESSLAEQIAPVPSAELRERDFELMHHYCTATADLLSARPEVCHIWRITIPREGYRHPYIMHGILAAAATHKAYLLPYQRRQYLALADYHQTVGSEGFRTALRAAEPDQAVALFGFACLVVMHMMALPGRCTDGKLTDAVDHFMELVGVFKGLMGTLAPLHSGVLRSELAPLVYTIWPIKDSEMPARFVSLEHTLLPPDTWQAIHALRARVAAEATPATAHDYLVAVEKLEESAKLVAFGGVHVEIGAVLAWISRVQMSVLADLDARRAPALLLLAYYSVFWATIDKTCWYARGWAREMFNAVEAELAGQARFADLLEWPRQSLQFIGV